MAMKRSKIPWLSRVSYRYQILPCRGWQPSPEWVATFKRNGWQLSTGIGGNLGPEYTDKSRVRFRWVKAPTSDELTQLTHTIAQRIARYLERLTLLERDAENSYLPAVSSITESGTEYLYMLRPSRRLPLTSLPRLPVA